MGEAHAPRRFGGCVPSCPGEVRDDDMALVTYEQVLANNVVMDDAKSMQNLKGDYLFKPVSSLESAGVTEKDLRFQPRRTSRRSGAGNHPLV